jgi:transcriptional regulator with XRE-family HTH domain
MMHIVHLNVKSGNAPRAFDQTMHQMHDLGMNLARIRKAKRLSQRDLADMVGLDQATIQRAETMHSSAKLETYQKCADALGVNLADLFAGDRDGAEAILLSAFRQLPPEKRPGLLAILDIVRQPGAL